MRFIQNTFMATTVGTAVLTVVGCSTIPQQALMHNYSRQSGMHNYLTSTQTAAAGTERLGTTWGDEISSSVRSVDLRRIDQTPVAQTQLNYADKYYYGQQINSMSLLGGKVEMSVLADRGTLPIYRDNGQYYLQGNAGQAYRLHYTNNSDRTYEIVASVDGLNVINGEAASRSASGYVLQPHDDLTIRGFRKSQDAVASFIFSTPNDAYAVNTPSGSIDNTGVIGTVMYELYDPNKPRPYSRSTQARTPNAYPADSGNQRYAQPPQ